MSVHPAVYRVLDELLARSEEPAWNG
jgi:hypothetical protein